MVTVYQARRLEACEVLLLLLLLITVVAGVGNGMVCEGSADQSPLLLLLLVRP